MYNPFSIFSRYVFNPSDKCKLFDSLVLPVLSYASEIWFHAKGVEVEAIHTTFCRKVLCVKRSTHLTALYGELGIVPLIVIRKCNMIRYWIKNLRLDDTK